MLPSLFIPDVRMMTMDFHPCAAGWSDHEMWYYRMARIFSMKRKNFCVRKKRAALKMPPF
jgi:hypothetical protein